MFLQLECGLPPSVSDHETANKLQVYLETLKSGETKGVYGKNSLTEKTNKLTVLAETLIDVIGKQVAQLKNLREEREKDCVQFASRAMSYQKLIELKDAKVKRLKKWASEAEENRQGANQEKEIALERFRKLADDMLRRSELVEERVQKIEEVVNQAFVDLEQERQQIAAEAQAEIENFNFQVGFLRESLEEKKQGKQRLKRIIKETISRSNDEVGKAKQETRKVKDLAKKEARERESELSSLKRKRDGLYKDLHLSKDKTCWLERQVEELKAQLKRKKEKRRGKRQKLEEKVAKKQSEVEERELRITQLKNNNNQLLSDNQNQAKKYDDLYNDYKEIRQNDLNLVDQYDQLKLRYENLEILYGNKKVGKYFTF